MMPAWLSRLLPLALLAALALWLRTADLGARPMHADEANQAVKAGQLLEDGRYAFDPRDHHGPLLYYTLLPVAWVRGQRTLAALDEATVRLVPALAGTVSVVLLWLLAAPLGRWPALAAAAFLAASPPSVYYSRYFVQETLLVTATLGAMLCAKSWWTTGRTRWAVALGVGLGLMQSTKESAPLFVVGAVLALLAIHLGPPGGKPGPVAGRSPPKVWRDVALALGSALAVAALFYSSFGANPAGLLDALRTYPEQAARLGSGATGHEKPWWYFLWLFGWQRAGGLVFQQAGFAALAVAGLIAAILRPNPLLRWAAAYSLLILLVHSAVAYKTPWLAIHLVPGFALLAAGALASVDREKLPVIAAAVVAAVVSGMLLIQTWRVTRTYAADARNPFAYVHSSPDVRKYRALVEAARGRLPHEPVRVISEEYWPLPWYFRGLDGIGYWARVPEDCDGSLVIASAGLADTVRSRLHGGYDEAFLGLRPGFVCVVFTPRKPEATRNGL